MNEKVEDAILETPRIRSFNIRHVSNDLHTLWSAAAKLRGQNMGLFARHAILREAQKVLNRELGEEKKCV